MPRNSVHLPGKIAFVLVLLGSGCPDDDVDVVSGDEVGDGDGDGVSGGAEVGDPEPVDPLIGAKDGDCSIAAGTNWVPWPSPSTLGNGLVHDSRLNLDDQPSVTQASLDDFADGVAWSSFVTPWKAMTHVGFRPAQVHAEVSVSSSDLEIVDQTVDIADDDSNYRTEIETYVFASASAEAGKTMFGPEKLDARPTSIETFTVTGGGLRQGFSLAWLYDGGELPWTVRVGSSHAAMLETIEELAEESYRPISLASRWREGAVEYSAVFVDDDMPASHWGASLGPDASALAVEIGTLWADGYYPFRVSSEQGSWTRLNLLWTRRPPGLAVRARLALTLTTFQNEDALRRSQGFHLESLARYVDGDVERYVAIWVRYQPCLRWTGTQFEPDDPSYATVYKMFHDVTLASMGWKDEQTQTPWLRPSVTLHIAQGSTRVLNRAYTYAPAIYPETQLDAPMKLASVAKSITAAAVVREMRKDELPLATPFVQAAFMPATPSTMKSATVLDALRHLGGFRGGSAVVVDDAILAHGGSPRSYENHFLIDASSFGDIPVSGAEVYDYAIQGGHLDTGDLDSYWDAARYLDSQLSSHLHYSNAGYTMLGELIRRRSNLSYEDYVSQYILEPLNLDAYVVPDPGHRKDAQGPTLAGLRSYLINAHHPYRDDPPTAPLFGAEPLAQVSAMHTPPDLTTRWAKNAGPPDVAAPDRASVGRYSGAPPWGEQRSQRRLVC